MTALERLELEAEIRSLRNALAETAQTTERACDRLLRYQPVIDAARALVYAFSEDDDAGGEAAGEALFKAVHDLDTETASA